VRDPPICSARTALRSSGSMLSTNLAVKSYAGEATIGAHSRSGRMATRKLGITFCAQSRSRLTRTVPPLGSARRPGRVPEHDTGRRFSVPGIGGY
jgi:hypothetical protein